MPPQAPKIRPVEVYWHTVTYKTVALLILLVVAMVVAGMYITVPNWTEAVTKKLDDVGERRLPHHPG